MSAPTLPSERVFHALEVLDILAEHHIGDDRKHILAAKGEVETLRQQLAASERTVDSLRERGDVEVCCAQAVEFAEYVTEHAKGKMVEAAQRFLSLPYSQELKEKLSRAEAAERTVNNWREAMRQLGEVNEYELDQIEQRATEISNKKD